MFASTLRKHAFRNSVSGSAVVAVVTAATAFLVVRAEEQKTECFWKKRNDKKVVIVGGGTAGIGVAAMLQNQGIRNVTVIEPKDVHYYQPLWTLVGGGVKSNTESVRPMKSILPRGTQWLQQSVESFTPNSNIVLLSDGSKVEYDYLIVAAGLKSDFTQVPGMEEGLKKEGSGVVSIYDYNYSAKVWKDFESIKTKPSKMIFTMPTTTLKCAGAPQKIMWLLEDTLRSQGLRQNADIKFWVPGPSMFGVKFYADKLEKLRQERGVEAEFGRVLVSLDIERKEATFKNKTNGEIVKQSYDLIHVCPDMVPPDFIKNSPLADSAGWVDVDQNTLQSKKYENVFALGDCTNTPNSKTAAAVTSQAPVLVHNLEQHMNGNEMDGYYEGYASCPLITGRKSVLLAEFGYGGKIMETFSRETGKFPYKLLGTEGALQQRFFYFLKEQLFPYVYWNLWVHGHWYGTNGPFKPSVVDKNKHD